MPKYQITESYIYEIYADNEEQAEEYFQIFMEHGENDDELEFVAKFIDNELEIMEEK